MDLRSNPAPSARPRAGGRMTAVMRAATVPDGPRVLRLGIVRAGRIVEDRIIKSRSTVTIGADERATLIVDAEGLSGPLALFERRGDGYRLHVAEGMTGRVALPIGIVEITAGTLDLDDMARGKLVVGDTTLLFQFVVAPNAPPRPRLPLGVQGDFASRIDWNLIIIVAFSFLVHFGFVGAMLSDWMDPVVNDDIVVGGLVDPMRTIAPPPVEVVLPTTSTTPDESPPRTQPAPVVNERRVITPTAPSANASSASSSAREREAARLTAEAEKMKLGVIASLNGPSTAVDRALRAEQVPPGDLSQAAKESIGVTHDPSALSLATGGAIVEPGKARPGLGMIGDARQNANGRAGEERRTVGPSVTQVVLPHVTTAPIANAESVVAKLRAKFKRCYDRGLQIDSTMQGSVTIIAKIAPNGEVSSAEARDRVGLDDAVASCISGHVRGAQFTSPGAGGSTINIPVKFVQGR